MSDKDVYDHEMLKKPFSDHDVERVLSGRTPESHELARLAPVLDALHADRPSAPPEASVARFAAAAAEIARSTASQQTATPATEDALPPARRWTRTFRRRVVVLATATLTFAAMTGVALAADTAAPGDPLYGIDRALEQIGINDGGAAERLTEAETLTEQGRVAEAMRHLAELVENDEGLEGRVSAAEALRNAADRVQETGDDSSASVRAAVATMLSEMADMTGDRGVDGAGYGARVSEMARLINGNGPDRTPAPGSAGPPVDHGPVDDLEPSQKAGPPEDQDAPGNQGQAGDQGPPEERGQPEDRGQPEGPGKSPSGAKP